MLRKLPPHRTNLSSGRWEGLEEDLAHASASVAFVEDDAIAVDLLEYCAFLADEIEANERLDLFADEEDVRIEQLAPYAVEALDAILRHRVLNERTESAFGAIRASLEAITPAFCFAA